jgi:hypothetical protein
MPILREGYKSIKTSLAMVMFMVLPCLRPKHQYEQEQENKSLCSISQNSTSIPVLIMKEGHKSMGSSLAMSIIFLYKI